MAKKIMSENDWQAQADASTLAQYEEIMSDSKRRNAAIKAARTQAADLTKRANAMSKVANKKGKK